MSLKILGFVAASLGAILGLTTGVVMWTTHEWLPPLAPVLYLASIFLALFLFMGGVWFIITRQEIAAGKGAEGESVEERGLKRLVMLASQVLIAVLGLTLVSLWNIDHVRAYLVATVADSHVRLEQPLRDPSPIVRLAACKEMFQRGWVYRSKNPLIASLNQHPNVAQACLEAAKLNQWKGASGIASELLRGWEAEMIASGDAAAEKMCEIAPWTPALDEIAEREPEVRLLRCATNANSNGIRHCCAEVLASRGALVETLGSPYEFDTETVPLVFSQLVRYGFRPLTLDEDRRKVAEALGTDDEGVRRWVAELGCSRLDPSTAQPELMGGFLPLIESQSCGLSEREQIEYTTPGAWGRVCQEIFESRADKPIEQLVCDAVQAARIEKAVDEARLRVWEAIRAPFLERDAEFVSAGLMDAEAIFAEERRGGGRSSIEESISGYRVAGSYRSGANRRGRSAHKELNLTGNSDPTCKRLVFGRHTQGLAKLNDWSEVETFDCERVNENMTVEEYHASKRVPKSSDAGMFENPFDAIQDYAAAKHGARGAAAARNGAREFKKLMKEQRSSR